MLSNKDKWDWKKSRGGFSLSTPSNSRFISKNKYFLTKIIKAFGYESE
jgi:hypothetical protein